jgi:hypothetical protein
MNKIRAKMHVSRVTHTDWNSEEVQLNANYSDNKEDNTYSAATPSAKFEMTISNPDAKGFFIPGKKYYVDFVECNEQTPKI